MALLKTETELAEHRRNIDRSRKRRSDPAHRPLGQSQHELVCVVEIPKGTRNKYEYDPQLGGIKFDRLLMSAATYPADYGYLRDTLALDGDPLDTLVCLYEPTFAGCLIPAKPVGMFKMRDEKGPDEKIICTSIRDPSWLHVEDIDDLLRDGPRHRRSGG